MPRRLAAPVGFGCWPRAVRSNRAGPFGFRGLFLVPSDSDVVFAGDCASFVRTSARPGFRSCPVRLVSVPSDSDVVFAGYWRVLRPSGDGPFNSVRTAARSLDRFSDGTPSGPSAPGAPPRRALQSGASSLQNDATCMGASRENTRLRVDARSGASFARPKLPKHVVTQHLSSPRAAGDPAPPTCVGGEGAPKWAFFEKSARRLGRAKAGGCRKNM